MSGFIAVWVFVWYQALSEYANEGVAGFIDHAHHVFAP